MEGAQPEHRLSASSLNAVEKFHGGRREDPVDWLNKLNRIGRNFNWSDRNKVDVALLRICGPAAVWAESIDSEVPWSEFEMLFLDRFTEPIEEAMARLTRCKQGPYESIIAYTDRFKSDARSANRVEDGALVWQYLEGMNPDLRVEIYRQGGNRPQSIDEISRFLKGWEANSASLNRFGPDPSNPPRDNRRNTDGTWTRFSKNNNNGPRNPNRGWSSGRYDGSNSRPRDFGNWRPRPPQQQYQDRRPMPPQQPAFLANPAPRPNPPPVSQDPTMEEITKQFEQMKLVLDERRRDMQRDARHNDAFNLFEECTSTEPNSPAAGANSEAALLDKLETEHAILLADFEQLRLLEHTLKHKPTASPVQTPSLPEEGMHFMDYISDGDSEVEHGQYALAGVEEIYVKRSHEDDAATASRMPRKRVAFGPSTNPGAQGVPPRPNGPKPQQNLQGRPAPNKQQDHRMSDPKPPGLYPKPPPPQRFPPNGNVAAHGTPSAGNTGIPAPKGDTYPLMPRAEQIPPAKPEVLAESKGKEMALKACKSISIDAAREAGTVLTATKIIAAGHMIGDQQLIEVGKEVARRTDAYMRRQVASLLKGHDATPAGTQVEHGIHYYSECSKDESPQFLGEWEEETPSEPTIRAPGRATMCQIPVKVAMSDEIYPAIVDTGASKSAITNFVLRKIGIDKHVVPVETVYLNADGRKTSSQGKIMNVPTTLGRMTTKVDFCVTNALNYDVLLGVDFLKSARAGIDLDNDKLRINLGGGLEEVLPLKCRLQAPSEEYAGQATMNMLQPVEKEVETMLILDEEITPAQEQDNTSNEPMKPATKYAEYTNPSADLIWQAYTAWRDELEEGQDPQAAGNAAAAALSTLMSQPSEEEIATPVMMMEPIATLDRTDNHIKEAIQLQQPVGHPEPLEVGIVLLNPNGPWEAQEMVRIASQLDKKIWQAIDAEALYPLIGWDLENGMYVDLQTTPDLTYEEVMAMLYDVAVTMLAPVRFVEPHLAHLGFSPSPRFWKSDVCDPAAPPTDPRLPLHQVILTVRAATSCSVPVDRTLPLSWGMKMVFPNADPVSLPFPGQGNTQHAKVDLEALPTQPRVQSPSSSDPPYTAWLETDARDWWNVSDTEDSDSIYSADADSEIYWTYQAHKVSSTPNAPTSPKAPWADAKSPANEPQLLDPLAGVPTDTTCLPFMFTDPWFKMMHDIVIPYIKKVPLWDLPAKTEVTSRGPFFTFWAMLLRSMYQASPSGVMPSGLLRDICSNFQMIGGVQGAQSYIDNYVTMGRRYVAKALLDNEMSMSTSGIAVLAAEYLLELNDVIKGCDEVLGRLNPSPLLYTGVPAENHGTTCMMNSNSMTMDLTASKIIDENTNPDAAIAKALAAQMTNENMAAPMTEEDLAVQTAIQLACEDAILMMMDCEEFEADQDLETTPVTNGTPSDDEVTAGDQDNGAFGSYYFEEVDDDATKKKSRDGSGSGSDSDSMPSLCSATSSDEDTDWDSDNASWGSMDSEHENEKEVWQAGSVLPVPFPKKGRVADRVDYCKRTCSYSPGTSTTDRTEAIYVFDPDIEVPASPSVAAACNLAKADQQESDSEEEIEVGCAAIHSGELPLMSIPAPGSIKTPDEIKIGEELTPQQARKLRQLLWEEKDIFAFTPEQLGKCGTVMFDIRLKSDAKPIAQRAYRMSPKEKEILKAEIEKMQELGLIKPSCSEWASPCVLVPKKDATHRLTLNYKKLNAVTAKDETPIPLLQEVLEMLGKA